ncbi:MAG TPA: nucleotidyltransferase domain-containing protein [Acidobacteriota bacterium]|nr:nucleotidyltransferase domain-containing protein [Acidobacteriota bacterium]
MYTTTTSVVFCDNDTEPEIEAQTESLRLLFTNPETSHHLREISELLQSDPANLSRELRRLEADGIFLLQKIGNQKHFRLNRQHPLYRELRSIVFKTVGLTALPRAALETVPGIEEAYLHGSFARHQDDAQSDVDLLIIGQPDASAVETTVRQLERKLKREINYVSMTREEFEDRQAGGDEFIREAVHLWTQHRP